MVQIVGNLEWELLKNVEIGKSKYGRITNTRFVDPLFENFAYIKKNHICSLLFNKIMFIWYEIRLCEVSENCAVYNWFKSCDILKTENMWNVAGYEDPRQTVFNMLHLDELLIKYN
jgi:hypothetical protein